jgi:L-methionine (R)-S-oxide reductase
MAESIIISEGTKKEKYESLIPQLKSLVEGESDVIANVSNIIAALKFSMNYFWVGVYFVRSYPASEIVQKKTELVLGPFQGPIACTRIAYGRGVCGKCWEQKKTIIVDDVDLFPGHIACSSLSKSEIVLPCFNEQGDVVLILDVDSEHIANFDETDKIYLEQVMEIINQCVDL